MQGLGRLRALAEADSRALMTGLALEQKLAGDAAVDFWWLTDLPRGIRQHGPRGDRLAQLGAALAGGKCWLAAYACGLGATGLTFIDSEVPATLAMPDEAAVMFLVAIGAPAPRPDRR
jgi:nitroreductase